MAGMLEPSDCPRCSFSERPASDPAANSVQSVSAIVWGMSPVDNFLTAVLTARIGQAQAWSDDAVLDATVPNWRWQVRGAEAIKGVFAGWYADPGRYDEIRRHPLPDGELIEFLLSWTEHGVPHAAHQAHVIRVESERIAEHTVYCGGRWPANLLAQMAEAADAN